VFYGRQGNKPKEEEITKLLEKRIQERTCELNNERKERCREE
jgi:hypothetical protein